MSLTDLKNKKPLKKKSQVSIEEFIEGASDYSRGLVERYNKPKPPGERKFKKSTFTLLPKQIDYLTELAEKTGLAKSKLIRLLIDDLANEAHIKIAQIQKLAEETEDDE